VKPEVPGMLKVDPPGVLRVSAALRERSDLVAAQRRVCDGIDVMPGGPDNGVWAGEVERDTRSIREFWPQDRTGELAAGDAARMGGALEEGHQAFECAVRALDELHTVLVTSRRKVEDLNQAHQLLAGPEEGFAVMQRAGFGNLPSPEELGLAEESLMGARTRSGFDSLADIDRAHAQVLRQVAEETTICDDLLNRLAGESSGLPGHASTSLP
jgi:hypothetical protein